MKDSECKSPSQFREAAKNKSGPGFLVQRNIAITSTTKSDFSGIPPRRQHPINGKNGVPHCKLANPNAITLDFTGLGPTRKAGSMLMAICDISS